MCCQRLPLGSRAATTVSVTRQLGDMRSELCFGHWRVGLRLREGGDGKGEQSSRQGYTTSDIHPRLMPFLTRKCNIAWLARSLS
jgi:hypothetical protein